MTTSELSPLKPITDVPSDRPTLLSRVIGPLAVVLLILVMQWPILSGYYSFLEIGPDITVMNVPDLELRAKALRSAILPIWDPYQFGGQSMLGMVTPALLDPFSYPLFLLPFKHGHIPYQNIQWYFALLHSAAGLAAYFLARDIGVRSKAAAVAAGIFYAMGGLPGNSAWIQFATESIYAPLTLLFVVRGLRGKAPLRNTAIAGALVGLSWFSGTHHLPYVTFVLCMAILLGFMLLGNRRQRLLQMAVFAVTMICISAPQTFPALECSRLSTRWVGLDAPIKGSGKVPFAAHFAGGLHIPSLLGMVFPLDHLYWTGTILFAGIVAVVFALLGGMRIASSRLVRLLVAMVVGGILMSLPRNNIFYGLTYLVVPMLDKVRETSIWIFVTHLGITCLLALGMDAFLVRQQPPRWLRGKVLVSVGVALLTITYVVQFIGTPQYQLGNDRLAVSGFVILLLGLMFCLFEREVLSRSIVAGCLIALLMIELANVATLGGSLYVPRGHGTQSRYEQPLRATDALADFLRSRKDVVRVDVDPNDIPYDFGDFQSIEELSTHSALLLTSVFEMGIWTPRTKQLYGVNYYLAKKPSQPDQVDLFTAPSGIKVFSNPGARPRVWAVHEARQVKDYGDARAVFSVPSFDMSKETILAGDLPSMQDCGNGDQVVLVNRSWFSVAIRAHMKCAGMVILNDNWYPGWRATLDEHPAKLYPAYMCIRGVLVPEGDHTIHMYYRPIAFYAGLLLFLVGVTIITGLVRRRELPGDDVLDM